MSIKSRIIVETIISAPRYIRTRKHLMKVRTQIRQYQELNIPEYPELNKPIKRNIKDNIKKYRQKTYTQIIKTGWDRHYQRKIPEISKGEILKGL